MLGRPAIVNGAHPASSDGGLSEDEREVDDSLCPYCKRPMTEADTAYDMVSMTSISR